MSFDSISDKWLVLPFGAEDGDEQPQGGEPNAGEPPANSQASQSNSQTDDDDDDDEYEGLTAKELRRIARDNAKKAKDAEREASSAKSKLSEEERKKLTADQQKDLQISELTEANTKLRNSLNQQAIINGILSDRRFEWHNPEIVAAQLDSSVVKVTDDGKVDGLPRELKRIATSEDFKFLLAKDNTKKSTQPNNENGQQTGVQPGQGGANQGGSMSPNVKELAEIMPALRSRM